MLFFTFSQISLEMSMLFLKTIILQCIPDKIDPANGAVALAAKSNSTGSIPPFCLKIFFFIEMGTLFSVIAFTFLIFQQQLYSLCG